MKNLLIIRFSAMGDVAMTVPVIRALNAQYPELKITVLSRPFFKPLFANLPGVHFFGADVSNDYKGIRGLTRLFKELKIRNFDAVADLHYVIRSRFLTLLFKLSGIQTSSLEKGRIEKKALIRTTKKVFKSLKHMTERHFDVLSALGYPIDQDRIPKWIPNILTENVLKFTGIKDTKWIGIAPFAQYQSKIYPIDLMREVVQKLANHNSYKIFLFGGKNEIEDLQKIQQSLSNVSIVTGELSFEEELILIQNLNIMLAMDSGNGHLAAMYDIPTITLWGNTHPYAGFKPFRQPLENSITSNRNIYPKIPTSVYGNKIPQGYEEVMRTISTNEIVEKMEYILNSNHN